MATRAKGHNQNLLPTADHAGDIATLRDDLRDERDQNLRTLADVTNYRLRVERDGIKRAEEGKREITLSLLDIIDDAEKAMPWASDTEQPGVKGVRLIHKTLLALLGRTEFSLSKGQVCPSPIVCMKLLPWRDMTMLNRKPLLMSCVAAISGTANYCAQRNYELPDDTCSV